MQANTDTHTHKDTHTHTHSINIWRSNVLSRENVRMCDCIASIVDSKTHTPNIGMNLCQKMTVKYMAFLDAIHTHTSESGALGNSMGSSLPNRELRNGKRHLFGQPHAIMMK